MCGPGVYLGQFFVVHSRNTRLDMIDFFNIPPLTIAGQAFITPIPYVATIFLTPERFIKGIPLGHWKGLQNPFFGSGAPLTHWVYYRRNISNGGTTV